MRTLYRLDEPFEVEIETALIYRTTEPGLSGSRNADGKLVLSGTTLQRPGIKWCC